MPPLGEYILTNTGFSNDKPVISLSRDDSFVDFNPIGQTLTMAFDTAQRYCVGWRDITTGVRHACPDSALVESKYEQCSACQKLTGFNPAFYHAASVSPQQEARNQEPHILYLAYFGGDLIKVGISHAARGNNRLLEQGARMAIILDTFPTAIIARQYEAKIAAMSGICETVATRQKLTALPTACDADKLRAMLARIRSQLQVDFNASDVLHHDALFFPNGTPNLATITDVTSQAIASGNIIGSLGSLLVFTQHDNNFLLPVKKFVGYKVSITNTIEELDTPAQQMTLF